MPKFNVTVALYGIEADSRKEAAMEAYSILQSTDPTIFHVTDENGFELVELSEDDVQAVLNRPLEGNEGAPGR
jgi:hypothetical protein